MNAIEEIIEDIRNGKMVVLMDDENRENEGDLVLAAEKVCPEDINFMARFARGLICLTLTQERCQQLRLPPMVSINGSPLGTKFTVSIEAATGVTTGISAADRARTIQVAVAQNAKPEDLIHPGHIFPLMAEPGGVLHRAGHTEAGCDLARLAGLFPAAVIVEILNEDGTMARREHLEAFAKRHSLKIGTIANLIAYRLLHEKTIERVAETLIETDYGEFRLIAYLDAYEEGLHFALVRGEIQHNEPTLVRVHMQDPLIDLVGARRPFAGWSLREATRKIAEEGRGVLVILQSKTSTQTLLQRVIKWQGQTQEHENDPNDIRQIGMGSQILTDLGVKKMRVLSSPKKLHALSGFHLEVVEYIPYTLA